MRVPHTLAAAMLTAASLTLAAPALSAGAGPGYGQGRGGAPQARPPMPQGEQDRDRDGDRDRVHDPRYDRDHPQHRDRFRWEYDYRERWRVRRHPQHDYWVGRKFRAVGPAMVITHHRDFDLPPPPRGHYYVRADRDVFLVRSSTNRIVDAFILHELLRR